MSAPRKQPGNTYLLYCTMERPECVWTGISHSWRMYTCICCQFTSISIASRRHSSTYLRPNEQYRQPRNQVETVDPRWSRRSETRIQSHQSLATKEGSLYRRFCPAWAQSTITRELATPTTAPAPIRKRHHAQQMQVPNRTAIVVNQSRWIATDAKA